MRFAIFGTGFWAKFQLAAWQEVGGAECVALYNRTRAKAEALGREFGIKAIYDDPEALLREVEVDFVDIITDVSTHADLTKLAARYGRHVICQKPMASTVEASKSMLDACEKAGVKLFVHENWRWQSTIRALSEILRSGEIGDVFRAGIDMISGFPVFENQPFLAEVEQFILSDLGSHTLDAARFLFGEARTLSCWTGQAHADIAGEDFATVMMTMGERPVQVLVRMAYAENFVERECFPQTLFFVEGTLGSVEVTPEYGLRVTTAAGTHLRKHPPPYYPWADPRYAIVHCSMVPCQEDLLAALRGERPGETTGADNLKTVELVAAAYRSAETGAPVKFA
jgi:predicted dehydrogenase